MVLKQGGRRTGDFVKHSNLLCLNKDHQEVPRNLKNKDRAMYTDKTRSIGVEMGEKQLKEARVSLSFFPSLFVFRYSLYLA